MEALSERLRDDPDFRRFWASRLVSIAGTLVTAVALPVLVYRTSGSASLTAMTTMLEGLPYLVFGLVAGAIADRSDRRRLMVAVDLTSALVVASVPLAWALDVLTVGHVLVVAFVTQALFVFFDGAAFGALPMLVGRTRVGAANSAIWGYAAALDFTVPLAVGAVLAVIHPAELLAVDALSFVASALLVAGIRSSLTGQRARASLAPRVLVGEVGEGLRWLWRHVGVRTQTGVSALQSLSGAGFLSLAVPYADRVLGVGTSGVRFGAVYAAWGLGGVAASVLARRAMARWPTAAVTLAVLPFSAAAGLVVATTQTWLVAVVGMAVWGVTYQTVVISSITYRQETTPEALLGRVNLAGRMLSFGIGWTGGALVAGALSAQVGVRPAMVTVVSAGVLATAFAWLSPLPRLAREGRELAAD